MKIKLIVVGKTVVPEVKVLFADYWQRVNRYNKAEEIVIENNSIRLTDADKIKQAEGELILKKLEPNDMLVLLDEAGKEFTSVQFARQLNEWTNRAPKAICFVVGGAYGFSEDVYQRAQAKLSLSKFTFPHQLVRVVFAEQLYRAYTILNNEPYHHP